MTVTSSGHSAVASASQLARHLQMDQKTLQVDIKAKAVPPIIAADMTRIQADQVAIARSATQRAHAAHEAALARAASTGDTAVNVLL